MKKSLLLLIIHIAFISIAFSQSLSKEIDEIILSELDDADGPGGVFMVAKKGKPIYQKAFGKANLEKLNIYDSISKYIPDYPNGNKITIHHLLTHTSGIKDFTKMKSLKDIAQKEMTPKMMVDFFKNEPVDFDPGEKFEYNNSGYILLGNIIELVSGITYEEYITENIFNKIGMSQSSYASDKKIIEKRAYGYQKKESGYVNKTIINFSVPYSSGALMSSLSDMLKWQNPLNKNVLLKAENSGKAFNKNKLNNGDEFSYGYGWHIRDIDGIITREHGGSIFGFKSMAVYIPAEDIYVIGFTNCDCFSPTKITQDIAKLVLENM